MHNRDTSILAEILPPEEREIEAVVGRYQRVAPAITRFARTLADNDDLRVRLGSEASASPDEIVIDPRLFQAAYARRAPVTPAEVALASALHEAVHLLTTNLDDPRPIPDDWKLEEATSEPAAVLDALSLAGGAAAVSLFFAVEDARQEAIGLSTYPGARSVLRDLYAAALGDGLSNSDALGQYALSCFFLIGDHATREELEKRVHGSVAPALSDALPFIEEARLATDPWEHATLTLQLLAVARMHGLLSEAETDESPASRKAKEDAEASEIAEAVDRIRLTTPVLQDAQSHDQTKQTAEAAALSQQQGDIDTAADAATDQILRISTAPTVYLPTGQGGKLVVDHLPDRFRLFAPQGDALIQETAQAWGVAQRHVSGELYPLFIANQRRGLRSGYDAGDLSPYAALFIGAGLYQRMYERRQRPTRRAYAVSLLIDGSASMLQPRPTENGTRTAPWGLAAATLGAWTLARLSDELQIDFEVGIFNRSFAATATDSEASFQRRRADATGGLRRTQSGAADRLTTTVNHYLIKPFEQPWRTAERLLSGLFWMAAEPKEAAAQCRRDPSESPPVSMFERAANVDEFNLTLAAQRMAARRARVRVMIVLADGMTRGSLRALSKAVESVEGSGTTVLGIGIGDDTVSEAYARSQVVDEPTALTRAMIDGTRAALRRSLALWGFDAWWIRASRQPAREETSV
ncbi:MAG: hypothetical protein ACE5MI_03955 [Acidimicrobiia bacterium]